ncbi:MAG TPA: RraA family protein [Chloroflexota bacterium]|jgi:4-hydroxy-4-methyl-2-oxoglutarate aldolase|nr:RraA family protein [Chloroflexota bacterium]
MIELPGWLNATLASDAAEGRNVLSPGIIRPLDPTWRVVGPAFVVLGSQDDNLAVNQAVMVPPPAGCVMVVGGQAGSRTATVGDLMALEIKNLGVLGLVTDGLVRDAQEIRRLEFPVWCRGTTPIASAKRGPGAVGGTVLIGGAVVRDGDLVIADDDGVVVWPRESVPELLTRARAKLDADNARAARLQAERR